jgi:hypothetical protein
MLSWVFIVIGVFLLFFGGPIPVPIPWFYQILGLSLMVGGPWLAQSMNIWKVSIKAIVIGWLIVGCGNFIWFSLHAIVFVGALSGGATTSEVEVILAPDLSWQIVFLLIVLPFTSLGAYVAARIAKQRELLHCVIVIGLTWIYGACKLIDNETMTILWSECLYYILIIPVGFYIGVTTSSKEENILTNQVNPPTLSLSGRKTKKLESGYKSTLKFTSSKNVSLDVLIFHVSIDDDSDVRIVDFWPSGGAVIAGPDSKNIASDGKKARLSYSLMSGDRPQFDLTLSGRARIKIEGNYLENEIIVSLE